MKNICILPWISIDRNRTRASDKVSLTPCCLYETDKAHSKINEYWNDPLTVSLRKSLLAGDRPSGCRLCWENEDKGVKSLRQSVNEGRLAEYKKRLTETNLTYKPVQVKYTAGTECNLACRMCLPTFSSKVARVWDILGKQSNTKTDDLLNDSDYILRNSGHIEYLDITGGEPFYHKKVKSLLQALVDKKDNEHITLHIVTNATRIDNQTIELLKKFKDVVLSISMEGVGGIQEYIRPGCDWKQLLDNIKKLQDNLFSLQVVSTLSVLNIIHLQDLERWSNENDLFWAQPGLIDNPPELAPHNLPYQLHEFVPERYKQYLTKGMTHDPVGYIKDLDKYWNTDITKQMPEWEAVFDNLHWQNNEQLVKMNEVAKKYVG